MTNIFQFVKSHKLITIFISLLIITIISLSMYILNQNKLLDLQYEVIQLQRGIIDDVIKTEKEMEKVYPQKSKKTLWKKASQFVGKVRAFEIPLKLALVSGRAESDFNEYAVGSFGERGTHQSTYSTMRSYFPKADPNKLIYWEVASWLHLKDCYEKSGRQFYLTLAYHNAGPGWKVPQRAMFAARIHISRCRVIRRRMAGGGMSV